MTTKQSLDALKKLGSRLLYWLLVIVGIWIWVTQLITPYDNPVGKQCGPHHKWVRTPGSYGVDGDISCEEYDE
jgi:hypothetical protein